MHVDEQRLRPYRAIAAAGWAVTAPLLALAYFATEHGRESLEMTTVSAWADPARDILEPLLTFASPDRVYITYLLVLAGLFPAVFLTALSVRSDRPVDIRRGERWSWRLTLTGYGMFGIGLAFVALLMLLVGTNATAVDAVFMATAVPGLLISLVGSTALGISILRGHYAPKVTGWLLALALPLWIVGGGMLGHNSIGLFPIVVAWAVSTPSGVAAPARAST